MMILGGGGLLLGSAGSVKRTDGIKRTFWYVLLNM